MLRLWVLQVRHQTARTGLQQNVYHYGVGRVSAGCLIFLACQTQYVGHALSTAVNALQLLVGGLELVDFAELASCESP